MIEIIKEKPSGTVWVAAEENELVEFIPAIPTYEYESDWMENKTSKIIMSFWVNY